MGLKVRTRDKLKWNRKCLLIFSVFALRAERRIFGQGEISKVFGIGKLSSR